MFLSACSPQIWGRFIVLHRCRASPGANGTPKCGFFAGETPSRGLLFQMRESVQISETDIELNAINYYEQMKYMKDCKSEK